MTGSSHRGYGSVEGNSSLRANLMAVSATVVGVLPVFLLGGLSIFLRREIGFGLGPLGVAVSVYFAASALTSAPAGGLVDRMGARAGLTLSVTASALTLVGMGVATRLIHLVVLLSVGGAANAVTQVSTNLLLAQSVTLGRQGLSYGVKQSAIPVATLLAGASVGTAAAGVGWRTMFVLASLLAAMVLAGVFRLRMPKSGTRRSARLTGSEVRTLLKLAAAGAFGAAGANALGAFLVESSSVWVPHAQAGLLLMVGSTCGIVTRLGAGWMADRLRADPLGIVLVQFGLAVAGFLWLAHAQSGAALAMATVLAFAAGWGWTGVLNYAVVKRYPRAPARATGITQAGVFIGAVFGPAAFGLLADRVSYRAAWSLAAGLAALAFGAVALSLRSATERPLQPPLQPQGHG